MKCAAGMGMHVDTTAWIFWFDWVRGFHVWQNEYLGLVEQCMNFAYELMDLCRGTQEVEAVPAWWTLLLLLYVVSEVEAVLSECREEVEDESCATLARLKMAIQYEEKKVSKIELPAPEIHLSSLESPKTEIINIYRSKQTYAVWDIARSVTASKNSRIKLLVAEGCQQFPVNGNNLKNA